MKWTKGTRTIAAKSFGDGTQAIHKDKECDLGPVAGF